MKRILISATLAAVAASLACVGVLMLLDVEPEPAVIGGVVSAVVATTVTSLKKKDTAE